MNYPKIGIRPIIDGRLGGAFCPPLMGMIADHSGMAVAFIIPMVCFAFIGWYRVRGYQRKPRATYFNAVL